MGQGFADALAVSSGVAHGGQGTADRLNSRCFKGNGGDDATAFANPVVTYFTSGAATHDSSAIEQLCYRLHEKRISQKRRSSENRYQLRSHCGQWSEALCRVLSCLEQKLLDLHGNFTPMVKAEICLPVRSDEASQIRQHALWRHYRLRQAAEHKAMLIAHRAGLFRQCELHGRARCL